MSKEISGRGDTPLLASQYGGFPIFFTGSQAAAPGRPTLPALARGSPPNSLQFPQNLPVFGLAALPGAGVPIS